MLGDSMQLPDCLLTKSSWIGVPAFTGSLLALPSPFLHLLSLLSHTDEATPLLSSSVLSNLLTASLRIFAKPTPDVKAALPQLYHFLANLTKSPDVHLQDIAIQSYISLLRSSYARITFWSLQADTIVPIVKILETAGGQNGNTSDRGGTVGGSAGGVQGSVGLQLLYHVLLVIWELTFEEVVAGEINPWVISPIADMVSLPLIDFHR